MAEDGRPRRQPFRKLTVEQYLDFIDSNKELDLTVPYLNQIINMHGFKKIQRTPRSVMAEAVKTMELMDPSRSTVGDAGVSSDAFIPIDDLLKDINELKWQDCCITSLETIIAVDHHHQQVSNSESTSLTVASAPSAKSKRPRKRPKKGVDDGAGCGLPLNSFEFGGSLTAPSCLVMKWFPKIKRSSKDKDLNEIGTGGDGDLGGSAFGAVELHPLSSSTSAFLPHGSN